MVWHSMGLQMSPENVTPAAIYAAAQVAGAPPALVHHVLDEAIRQQQQQQEQEQERQARAADAAAARSLELQMQGIALKQQSHAAAAAHPAVAAAASAAPASRHIMDSPWQQDFDPETGRYYYYNMSAGITQWEAPAEGYRPRMLDINALEQGLQQQQQQQQLGGHVESQPDVAGSSVNDHQVSAPAGKARAQEGDGNGGRAGRQRRKQHDISGGGGEASEAGNGGGGRGNGAGAGPTWQQQELMQRAAEEVEHHHAEQQRVELSPDEAAFVRTLMPRNMFKYFLQRYSLFSMYDQGIEMDREGW
jgi:trimethylguanosine synthase